MMAFFNQLRLLGIVLFALAVQACTAFVPNTAPETTIGRANPAASNSVGVTNAMDGIERWDSSVDTLPQGSTRHIVGQSRQPKTSAPSLPRDVRLIGLEGRAVEELLGRPSLARRERPAQYWRYSFAGCTMDVYFYGANDSKNLTVEYVDLRPAADAGRDNIRLCQELARRLDQERRNQSVPLYRESELTSH